MPPDRFGRFHGTSIVRTFLLVSIVTPFAALECAEIKDCATCVQDKLSRPRPFPVLGCSWCLTDSTCHAVGSTSDPCDSHHCISQSTFSQCRKRAISDCPAVPPPTPKHGWPTFSSKADLKASPWGDYMHAVYSGLPTSYPFDVASLWVLHDGEIIKQHVKAPTATDCPAKQLDRYNINDDYQPPKVSWIWHAYPYTARPASSWVEVIHEADPFGDESHGAWMLYTPGSGIYFNIGKTIAFAEHSDAYAHFNIAGGQDMNSAMSVAAAAAGYDSVQFTAHVDHVSYQCDTKNTGRPGFDYMGLEIVAVKMVGTFACLASGGAPTSVKCGWQAATSCSCDNSKQFLNCGGVPELHSNLTARLSSARRRKA